MEEEIIENETTQEQISNDEIILLLEEIRDSNSSILEYLTTPEDVEEVIEQELIEQEEQYSNMELISFLIIGLMIGYIFVRGAFDVWKR